MASRTLRLFFANKYDNRIDTDSPTPLGESASRAKLLDYVFHARGWSDDTICREEPAGAIVDTHIFEMSGVGAAAGLSRLKVAGDPADVLRETKRRIFSA
jgi:hypothetical protein